MPYRRYRHYVPRNDKITSHCEHIRLRSVQAGSLKQSSNNKTLHLNTNYNNNFVLLMEDCRVAVLLAMTVFIAERINKINLTAGLVLSGARIFPPALVA